MSSNHLKRLAMPRSWPLPRKTTVWVTRPTPGAHALELCISALSPPHLPVRVVACFVYFCVFNLSGLCPV